MFKKLLVATTALTLIAAPALARQNSNHGQEKSDYQSPIRYPSRGDQAIEGGWNTDKNQRQGYTGYNTSENRQNSQMNTNNRTTTTNRNQATTNRNQTVNDMNRASRQGRLNTATVNNAYVADEITGMDVYTSDNQEVGDVSEVLVSMNSDPMLVIQTGGFLGMGDELYAVPLKRAQINQEQDRININMTAAELQRQPRLQMLNTF